MAKLKPCPFCGGRAEIRDVHYSMKNWALQDKKWVEKEATCIFCNARSQHFKDENDAIEEWNRRAKEAKDAGK